MKSNESLMKICPDPVNNSQIARHAYNALQTLYMIQNPSKTPPVEIQTLLDSVDIYDYERDNIQELIEKRRTEKDKFYSSNNILPGFIDKIIKLQDEYETPNKKIGANQVKLTPEN